MPTETASWVGQSLSGGRYQVSAKLGEGGMAFVFRAADQHLGCDVVVKVPRPALLQEPEFAGRFAREVRSLVRLAHPHIVKLSDVGTHEGIPFAVMQYLPGGSLRDRLQPGPDGVGHPRPAGELRGWLGDVAGVLDFMHREGYLHRDVKPDNILFDQHGNVYLSDFGIAKALAGVEANPAHKTVLKTMLTNAGMVLGTAPYMAPEVLLGQEYDGRADQYALAVTVYQMLSGVVPFDGATPAAIVMQQTASVAPKLSDRLPGLPQALAAVVHRGMHRDPRQRFPDCQTFAQAVLAALPAVRPPLVTAAPAIVDLSGRQVVLQEMPVPVTAVEDTGRVGYTRPEPKPVPVVSCPGCGKTLKIGDSLHGKKVRCPRCNMAFALPALSTSSGSTDPIGIAIEGVVPDPRPVPARRKMPPPPAREAPPAEPRSKALLVFSLLALVLLPLTGWLAWQLLREKDGNQGQAKGTSAGAGDGKDDRKKELKNDQQKARKDAPKDDQPGKHAELQKGLKALAARDLDLALACFSEALRLDKGFADAYHARGKVYALQRKYAQAVADQTEALRLQPQLTAALVGRARVYTAQRDFDKAMADCDTLLGSKAQAAGHAQRGLIHAAQHVYDRAFDDFGKALQLDPSLAATYVDRAWLQCQTAFLYNISTGYDKVIKDCDEALRLEPRLPEALAVRGAGHLFKHNEDQAIADCDAALQRDPQLAIAYAIRGRARAEKKDFEPALRDCNKALELDPHFAFAHDYRGDVHSRKGDTEQALRDYSEAIRLDPQFAIAYCDRGGVYHFKRQWNQAVADYSQALRLDRRFAQAYSARGTAHYMLRADELAFQDFCDAIQLNNSDAAAYNGRGKVYQVKKDYANALRDHDEAVRLRPSNAEYRCDRGDTHYSKFNDTKAVEDYSEAIRLSPNTSHYWYRRGELRCSLGQYAAARDDCTEAIRRNTFNDQAYNMRGVISFREKNYDRALQDFSEAIRLKSTIAVYHRNRGDARFYLFQDDAALADYSEAIRLNRFDDRTFNLRGITHFRKKNYDSALQDFSEAIRLKPTMAVYHRNRGDARFNLLQDDAAISDYSEAIRLNRFDDRTYNLRGNVYYAKKNYQQSINDYSEAIRLNANVAVYYTNRANAYNQLGNVGLADADRQKAKQLGGGF